ncbi:MAG: hypothetical protein JST04_00110 [Bdellovibrionales bacterium]|nr:hypothetical protein [Bdellovibrionales bacterium]
MTLCYEQGFISLNQVERYLFREADPRRARERVLELERAGYVFRTKTYGESRNTLVRLTLAGLAVALGNTDLEIKPRSRIDFATLDHDLKLIDIRMKLEERWKDFRWIPERAIRAADYPEVPDGLCLFSDGRKVAIELENSLKGEARTLRLLSRWRDTDVSLVIYFASHPGIRRKYERLLAHHEIGVETRVFDLSALLSHDARSFPEDLGTSGEE